MNLEEFQEAGGQDPAQQLPKDPAPAGPTREEYTQLNARLQEIADENRHNRELLQQFFTREQQRNAQPSGDDTDDDPEVDGDIADDFATNGIEALKKRGVLTKKEAKELMREVAREEAQHVVQKSQNSLIKDAEMAREFPDLQDNSSELFKRTQAIYRAEIAEDPKAASNPRTLYRAAKEARAELITEGKYGRVSQLRDDDGYGDQRQRRIDAQSGDRSNRGRGNDRHMDDDDVLSPAQRSLIARFQATGEAEISEEDYIARARKGLTVRGAR